MRSAYRTTPAARTSTGLPRSARMSYDRGGCLLCPEDSGALPGWAGFPTGACRFSAASPCTPLQHPIGGADRNETSARGSSSSPGKPGTSLCRAPLRTGHAPFNASGSSKPRRLAGGQKRRSRAMLGIVPGVAVGVCETGFGLVRRAVLPRRDRVIILRAASSHCSHSRGLCGGSSMGKSQSPQSEQRPCWARRAAGWSCRSVGVAPCVVASPSSRPARGHPGMLRS